MKTTRLLLAYPPGWRAQYGDELAALIEQMSSDGRHITWHDRQDIVLAATRERLRASGLTGDGVPPAERMRSGSLLVLCAWMLFVVAGVAVQKTSEHWQNLVPASKQGLPAAAFDTLVVAAAVGSLLVLAGLALALPSLVSLIRDGGWQRIRRPILRALAVSVPTTGVVAGTIVWAHRLSSTQRNGADGRYSLVFVLLVLLVVGSLAAWTVAAVSIARKLELGARVLAAESRLAGAIGVAMAVMTVATAVWWASLGAAWSQFEPDLAVALALMLAATVLGALGAARAQPVR